MKTYWDLTEKERSALSSDDVDRFVAAELMTKGVLRAVAPVPEPIPEAPQPTLTVYKIKDAPYSTCSSVFLNLDDARQFLRLRPRSLASTYMPSGSIYYARPMPGDVTIEESQVYTEDQSKEFAAVIRLAAAAKERNDKATEQYEKELAANEEALTSMRDDWRACQRKALKIGRIVATFDEYRETADGDPSVARKFLAKAFTLAELQDAEEWSGTLLVDPEHTERPMPVDQPAEAAF